MKQQLLIPRLLRSSRVAAMATGGALLVLASCSGSKSTSRHDADNGPGGADTSGPSRDGGLGDPSTLPQGNGDARDIGLNADVLHTASDGRVDVSGSGGTTGNDGSTTDASAGIDTVRTGDAAPEVPTPVGGGTAVDVAAGREFSCALFAKGTVECWGRNNNGVLGNGTTNDSLRPVAVANLTNATAISAGERHVCALLADGTVSCWGNTDFGQIGRTTASMTPVLVSGVTGATAIAAGSTHTCALLAGGTVTCWGSITPTDRVTAVAGISGAMAIAAGRDFSCAVVAGGAVNCWGVNGSGRLGDGTTDTSYIPVVVAGIAGATAIAAGESFACALLSGGTVSCWGSNGRGQLGNGGIGGPSPVNVKGLTGATAITAAGADSPALGAHACAIVAGGAIVCWGSSTYGELGIGTSIAPDNCSTYHDCSRSPVPVSRLSGATKVAAGLTHTCAVVAGTVQCWGDNSEGQIANGALTPLSVPGVVNALALTASHETTCALLSGGTVKCWGSNHDGLLGNASKVPSFEPVSISSLTGSTAVSAGYGTACALVTGGGADCWSGNTMEAVSGLTGAVAIASGLTHVCAVLSDGTAKCWGNGSYGQLGNGKASTSQVPVAVSGLAGATAIAAANQTTCAVVSGGAVQCWGVNRYGELGNETPLYSLVPVAATGVTGAVAISMGMGEKETVHACALLAAGTLQCWGDNSSGQLGIGTLTRYASPVAVPNLSGVTAVASGGAHTCALLTDGTVRCWGNNSYGQFGNWDRSKSLVPAPVFGLTGVKAITAGERHTCAVLSDGTVSCWGDNTSGQIGPGTTAPVTIQYL